MATIRDVARRAGVSVATVSHVLNDTRPVLPGTRRAVLSAVEALRYRPSAVARGLTTQSTRTVGVVIADVTSPFFAFLLRKVEDLLAASDYNLLVCNTFEQPEREARLLQMLLDKRVDGVLLTPTGLPQPMYDEFTARRVPLVFIDRRPSGVPASFVGTDNHKAACEVTRYLLGLGHRRIALMSLATETTPVLARNAGYQEALRDAGLSVAPELQVTAALDADAACAAAKGLLTLADPPSAIIAGSHTATLGVLKATRELGLRYPDDVSLVCFDNSRWTDVMQPALTVVTKPIDTLATAAVEILLDSIREIERRRKQRELAEALPERALMLDTRLIVRESCGPARARPGA